MLGPDQPVILHLVDLPQFENGLEGLKMELTDCAFPLLHSTISTSQLSVGFKDIDYALFIGAKPRTKGMERADLMKDNAKIFIEQGKALNDHAKRSVKSIVVGNPANTNCLILQHYAKDIKKENFTAMTRLDHNRALSALSNKLKAPLDEITQFCIWGNHSPTMFPDTFNAKLRNESLHQKLDQEWRTKTFIPSVQQRGAEIIKARGLSSAASAGNAAIDHMRDWILGSNGWTSMGVFTRGEYGVEKGLIFSFPIVCNNGNWKIVEGVQVGEEQRERIKHTEDELIKEREMVSHLLK